MEKLNIEGWEWLDKYDSYDCPYCFVSVSPKRTMCTINKIDVYSKEKIHVASDFIKSYLYFCNLCGRPTFQDGLQNNEYFPKKIFGQKIELPEKYKEIQEGFEELKKCISVNAFTAAVMIGRKLLTIIAYNYPQISDEIKKKIENNQIKFIECVDELKKINALPFINHYLFDIVRKLGNNANHQLEQRSKDDAKEIYEALELIMRTLEKADKNKKV